MKNLISKGIIIVLFLSTLCTSCDGDDTPNYDKKQINNPELTAALQKQGLEFEGNMLVMNDKAQNLTTLDLSHSGLTQLAGLELFPKLEEVNLSGNAFDIKFDFAALPDNITKIDLSDNKIYEYNGLVDVDFDAAKVTVLRKFDKLVLPYAARYNMDALPYYFKEGGATDMQMQNKQGQPEKYTTLREVPDEEMAKVLTDFFPSLMNDGKIDIAKHLNLEEKQKGISFNNFTGTVTPIIKDVKNLEGIEFIINNPEYEGKIYLEYSSKLKQRLEYLKPGKKLKVLSLHYFDIPIIDLSIAENLYKYVMVSNHELESIDLSASKKFMQQQEESHGGGQTLDADLLIVVDCPRLKTLKLPELSNVPAPVAIHSIVLMKLPQLEMDVFDMSKIQVIQSISLAGLEKIKKINYPNEILYYIYQGYDERKLKEYYGDKYRGDIELNIDKDVYDRNETKAFIKTQKADNRIKISETWFTLLGMKPYDYLSSSRSVIDEE